MNRDVNYLMAKLESIHEDVKQLQIHVDELRQESAGKKAITRFLLSSTGVMGATLVWVVDHVLTMMRH